MRHPYELIMHIVERMVASFDIDFLFAETAEKGAKVEEFIGVVGKAGVLDGGGW